MEHTKLFSDRPRALTAAAALALGVAALVVGCSGSDGTPTTSTSSSSNASSSSGTGGDGGAGGGVGGAGGMGGAGGAGGQQPMKPADCVDLPLAGIELLSQQENTFDSSGSVPIIRTPSSLANISGDDTLSDRLRLFYDGALGTGVHAMDGDPTHALPDFKTTFVPTCNACAVFQEDLGDNTYLKNFAVKSGELEITALVTPHQTAGVARHVELREVVKDAMTGAWGWVDGGTCYWIEEASYDGRRPKGCVPYAFDACPADQFCMPTNAVGTDGECVTGGAKVEGEACTRVSDTQWDSDCSLGLRCFDGGMGAICHKVCDLHAAAPDCPAGTHCGGGYNLCLDVAILQNSGVDDASLGETCATNPGALYCGGAGQPGMCWDDDGDAGPMEATCIPFVSAPSQCVAPRTAGYVAYKDGIDQSTLFCIPPP
ncbi:hypothetical protein [Polyangium sp. y55x31]|uniref:hypothetical protein n=1 Tax=Polyangium sp. y55x31 TaxID=3042688 RepID=UPI0024823887|nr:hypothetical protein [Polyangium sp. y55x31]MDI1481476.1 hypothetical protein [Polyangium sp. y55x31]